MCCIAAIIIMYGEKYQIVIGNNSIENVIRNLRMFCKVIKSSDFVCQVNYATNYFIALPSKLVKDFLFLVPSFEF